MEKQKSIFTINDEDLELLKRFLVETEGGNYKSFAGQLTEIQDTIKELLVISSQIKAPDDNFNYYDSLNNILNHGTAKLYDLVQAYPKAKELEYKRLLFKMPIVEMTGREFADYLVYLGLVKKNYDSQEEGGVESY